ncbi:hypothetical protein IWX46DRAFT_638887 [Phyllosticta citricarpa]|uniref:Prokaryotic-type class I peptide chain release factors domain-containing protein n=1 Tax=Phyllosticta citricarpa TaxID=55181 RepID=A0ABR1MKH8_9PEZI
MNSFGWLCRAYRLRPHIRVRPVSLRFQSTSAAQDVAPPIALPPAVVSRARRLVAEQEQLEQKLIEKYDMATAKEAGEMSHITEAYKTWSKASEALTELQKILGDHKADPELRDLAAEDLSATVNQLNDASDSLTKALIPKHPFAKLPCLLEIRPGIGGQEATLFAGDLLYMYQAFCSREGLRSSVLKLDRADVSASSGTSSSVEPITEAILEINEEGAYERFRGEAGVHRVQRVPITESMGRTHTSTATVLVLPSFPASGGGSMEDANDPTSDYFIDPKQVRVEVMRAGGAGGQHVNKTESAVRLTHMPTNTVVSMQDSRSQHANKEKAWTLLRARIAQARREKREEQEVEMRRSVVGPAKQGREHKIRTYNFGQGRVSDHRSGVTLMALYDVIEGGPNLETIMESVRQWQKNQDVEQMVAIEERQRKLAELKKRLGRK